MSAFRGSSHGSGLRVTRAAVFAALLVTLSAGAHVLLSDAPLPAPAVAAVFAVVFLLALLLAGERERGLWAIAGLLLPLQLAADTVFTAGQATCYGPGGGPVTGPLRMLGVDLICGGADFGAPLTQLAGPVDLPGGPLGLLAAHLIAGFVAACWLRGGEAAVARTLRAAVAAGFRPLLVAFAFVRASVPAAPGATPRPDSRDGHLPATLSLYRSVLRRGPPAGTALAV
ncbi:hypothetical protein [Streptomyces avicenniae]|uniref:hypothetical protein n=1 Tax=Streptomyces avicenniae TaxID=500153 RepID=UPI00069B0467|nr:hypothetical protein [Streptomyces avicenniae]